MATPESMAKRILVVEDESPIGELCRRALMAEGFEVDLAANGRIAMDMIKANRYDLCLLDIRMPEIDGKQLYSWMKSEGIELANAVIIMSGSVMGEETLKFTGESGRPFLPKPFSARQLIDAVKPALAALGK